MIIRTSFLLAVLTVGALGSNFYVEEDSKKCLLVNMDGQITVNKKTHKVESKTSKQNGTCSQDIISVTKAQIKIALSDGTFLELTFTHNGKMAMLKSIVFEGDGQTLKNDSVDLVLSDKTHYFECHSLLVFPLGGKTATLTVNSIKLQAFNVGGDFSPKGDKCSQDVTSTTSRTTHSTKTTSNTTPSTKTTSETTPTTKPTPKPTSTPKPTPQPTPFFQVKDSQGDICLTAQMDATFTILYYTTTKQTKSIVRLDQKHHSFRVDGSCGANTESLSVNFWPTSGEAWTLTLDLAKLEGLAAKPSHFALTGASLSYTLDNVTFPHTNDTGDRVVNTTFKDEYETTVGDYYKCNGEKQLKLSADVTLTTHDFRLQGFRTGNSTDHFVGKQKECAADSIANNIVPIAVGAALAVLVIIVLITYLIGRRRRQPGYQSI